MVEGDVALTYFGIVQDGVADTREQVRLYIRSMAQAPALEQFQEHLMDRILSAAPFARDRYGKEQERGAMLAL